ncbi:hypothetical protein K7X08_027817 [Anisodus acutangulus]|uniref:Uncharacterized protein n=1 Tax=Anisodus acutangulus TaxID=402998 RepID=A0A9Q1LMF8_9SOLA|nr:hypothetical protein K7X08_027817 [Anisodus acutangulus]
MVPGQVTNNGDIEISTSNSAEEIKVPEHAKDGSEQSNNEGTDDVEEVAESSNQVSIDTAQSGKMVEDAFQSAEDIEYE